MQIILVDVNPAIVDAWFEEFKGRDNIEILNKPFQEIKKPNCIMTAAGNSFGIMGGGIDLAIARFFPGIEKQVQDQITKHFHGECLVGNAVYVSNLFLSSEIRYLWNGLIYSPTMRSPSIIHKTDNVYKATFATLTAHYNVFEGNSNFTLVMPGFGGNCGEVSPKSITRQMRLAIDNFLGLGSKTIDYKSQMYLRHAEILEAVNL